MMYVEVNLMKGVTFNTARIEFILSTEHVNCFKIRGKESFYNKTATIESINIEPLGNASVKISIDMVYRCGLFDFIVESVMIIIEAICFRFNHLAVIEITSPEYENMATCKVKLPGFDLRGLTVGLRQSYKKTLACKDLSTLSMTIFRPRSNYSDIERDINDCLDALICLLEKYKNDGGIK